MKLFFAFLVLGGIAFAIQKKAPAPPARTAPEPHAVVQASPSPHPGAFLTRPFDRTHEALNAARKNVSENKF